MPGPFYFAWGDEDTPFDEAALVEDEAIFELELAQAEGDFAALTIEVANPRIGLLGPGRRQWCWVSWFDGSEVQPLFHGRLVGVPDRLTDEVVRLMFLARPSDYPARKGALAATLRVLPYWDPVWLIQSVDDPDTVLEAYSALWHTDRLTHDLTISDALDGEDGLIDVSEAEHFYDAVEVSFGSSPLRSVVVIGTVTWTQAWVGDVDLTAPLVSAFQEAGSPFSWPMVSSYTGDGLLSDWPKPDASLSGGWAIGSDAFASLATDVQPAAFAVRYTDKSDPTSVTGVDFRDPLGNALPGEQAHQFFVNWKNFDVTFNCVPIRTKLTCTFTAARKRSEIASFTLGASVQSILTDPAGADEETVTLNSTFVDQPVDDAGALPIGDTRRNAYFSTDRGQQSLQFLMLLARAKLRARSRAVEIKFQGTWSKLAAAVSCRKRVLLHDRRLPGGEAAGKITGYRLVASGSGANFVEVTLGCAIGYGIVLPAADDGVDTYANGYSRGYTARTGGKVAVIPGELHYDDLSSTFVIDDDDVDLFRMTPERVIRTLTVTDGPTDQGNAIRYSLDHQGEPLPPSTNTTATLSGTDVTNIANTAGLTPGFDYQITGPGIPSPSTSADPPGAPTKLHLTGPHAGTLTSPFGGAAGFNASGLLISNFPPNPAPPIGGPPPDPIGTLGKHPTVVSLELVPVTGGEFQTGYAIAVDNLVLPKMIDLEAA